MIKSKQAPCMLLKKKKAAAGKNWKDIWCKKLRCKIGKSSCGQESDYRVYHFRIREYIGYSLYALCLIAVFVYIFYRSLPLFLCVAPLCLFYPKWKKKALVKKRKQKLLLEFKEAILIVSALVSAGYSLENAVGESLSELHLLFGEKAMIVEEFSLLCRKLRVNKSIECAVEEFALRSGVEEIEHFSSIIKAAKRSGGRLADIFEQSVRVISDRISIKEEILTLSSARIFEQKLMNFFPLAMILYIDFSSPDYFACMYESLPGRGLMSAALVVYILAVVIANHTLEVHL